MAGFFNIAFDGTLTDPETLQEYTQKDIDQILDVAIWDYTFENTQFDFTPMHKCTESDFKTYNIEEAEYAVITGLEFSERCLDNGICFCPGRDDFNLYVDKGMTMVLFTKCGNLF